MVPGIELRSMRARQTGAIHRRSARRPSGQGLIRQVRQEPATLAAMSAGAVGFGLGQQGAIAGCVVGPSHGLVVLRHGFQVRRSNAQHEFIFSLKVFFGVFLL